VSVLRIYPATMAQLILSILTHSPFLSIHWYYEVNLNGCNVSVLVLPVIFEAGNSLVVSYW